MKKEKGKRKKKVCDGNQVADSWKLTAERSLLDIAGSTPYI